MTNPSATMLVFVSDKLACVKITGRANFTYSLDFKTLVEELLRRGFECFVLDLSECVLMDSTFLGGLAGFGLKMNARKENPEEASAIELLNPNPRIAELLENLGVLHLFRVVNGARPGIPPLGVAPTTAPTLDPSREEVISNCLEAHKILMSIDPANVPKFKEVTQFLAEDLKKLKNAS